MSGTHEVTLILTLAGGLSAALVLGFITQKLHLSPLVGYLLAGVLVGPHSPGFVADAATAAQCAEIGVILLMFGVGLHFHLKDLLAVRNIAVAGAVAQIGLTTVASMGILSLFGFSLLAGAVFGMSVSVASTVVLTRVLSDNHALHTRTGHVARQDAQLRGNVAHFATRVGSEFEFVHKTCPYCIYSVRSERIMRSSSSRRSAGVSVNRKPKWEKRLKSQGRKCSTLPKSRRRAS